MNPENTLENKIAKSLKRVKKTRILMGLIKNTYSTDFFHWLKKVATRYFQTRTDATYSKEEAECCFFYQNHR